MLQKLPLALILIVLAISGAQAQQETLIGGPNGGITGIWVSLNRNYSNFDADDGTARGHTIGLEIGKEFTLGYAREYMRESPLIGADEKPFDLSYRGGLISYAPLVHKAVHPRIALIGGTGEAEFGDTDLGRVWVIRPSAGLEVNVVKWFRLGIEGGYRHVVYDELDDLNRDAFSAWFVELGLRFGLSWED